MKKLLLLILIIITLFSFSMLYSCGETTDNEYDGIVIELEDSLAYVEVGGTFKINYLATNSEGKTAKWKSDDNSICTIVGGVVSGLKEGTTKVTLTVGDAKAECEIIVFTFQEETASPITDTFEVYSDYIDGELYGNDLVIELKSYGLTYFKNAKATLTNGEITKQVALRPSSNKEKIFINGTEFGASLYGENVKLILATGDKRVTIPFSKVVTKFIRSYNDVENLFFYGNLDVVSGFYTYDGYFIQTQTIDLDFVPLNYRTHTVVSGGIYFLNDPVYIHPDYPEGRVCTGAVASGFLYSWFNVDVGFLGTYDGQGNALLNVSLLNDNNHVAGADKGNRGGIFGNVSRKGVIKNLAVTAGANWGWYSYTTNNCLANSINGTLENVYVKLIAEARPIGAGQDRDTATSNVNTLAYCISGATLKNVVAEYDATAIEHVYKETHNDLWIFALVGPENQYVDGKSILNGDNVDPSKITADSVIIWENSSYDINVYENTYFFYTKLDGVNLRYSSDPTFTNRKNPPFEAYAYGEIPDKEFVLDDWTYWELSEQNYPVFKGIS